MDIRNFRVIRTGDYYIEVIALTTDATFWHCSGMRTTKGEMQWKWNPLPPLPPNAKKEGDDA